MTQMKAFLSPVPLNVGPSGESRGLDSTLGGVPIRCCSAFYRKQGVLSEALHREGNVSRCDCNIQADEKGVVSFETTFTEIPCGNAACGIQMFVLAASISPPANVKPTSVVPIVVSWLNTHESRNGLRGSSQQRGQLCPGGAARSAVSRSLTLDVAG